tara:strand:- start:12123 stop:12311 length:189 start_codon:yes stop_codon:yes gene_type:complete
MFINLLPRSDMSEEKSLETRRSEARMLSGQLGMFAEENDIPRDLWDKLQQQIFDYYDIENDR